MSLSSHIHFAKYHVRPSSGHAVTAKGILIQNTRALVRSKAWPDQAEFLFYGSVRSRKTSQNACDADYKSLPPEPAPSRKPPRCLQLCPAYRVEVALLYNSIAWLIVGITQDYLGLQFVTCREQCYPHEARREELTRVQDTLHPSLDGR